MKNPTKKLLELSEFVKNAAMLDNPENYAISIQHLQIKSKSDFLIAESICDFLISDEKFKPGVSVKASLFREAIKSREKEIAGMIDKKKIGIVC